VPTPPDESENIIYCCLYKGLHLLKTSQTLIHNFYLLFNVYNALSLNDGNVEKFIPDPNQSQTVIDRSLSEGLPLQTVHKCLYSLVPI